MASSRLKSLTRSSDFLKLKENGHKLKVTSWLLVNYSLNNCGELRLGLTVQKKVGPAIVRNRLKRKVRSQMRELLRDNKVRSIDVNFIFIPQKNPEFFKLLREEEFLAAFTKLQRVILAVDAPSSNRSHS